MIHPLHLSRVASACRALNAELHGNDPAFTRVSTDTRELQPGDLFVALRGERFDAHDFLAVAVERGACALVVEGYRSSLDIPQLVVRDSLLALGQIASLNRDAFTGPLVAITGSSGKTTVKTMVARILSEVGETLSTRGNFNNHIGVPLTLLQLEARHTHAVIEMGASGPGEIAYLCQLARPRVAMINNVMPAHIKGFGSLDGVARAKGEIYDGLAPDGCAVVNLDDAFAPLWLAQLAGREVIGVALSAHGTSGREAQVYADDVDLAADHLAFTLVLAGERFPVRMAVPGEHNLRNALMAAACARAVGVTGEQIQRGLAAFVPVAGRMNRQPGKAGASIIDDSYNANPGSVRAAIDVLVAQPGKSILVLGDMAELGEEAAQLHAETGRYARQHGLKLMFTVGDLSRHASDAFGTGSRHFTSQSDMLSALESLLGPDTTLLIKGSRSARMDQVVRALCEPTPHSHGDAH